MRQQQELQEMLPPRYLSLFTSPNHLDTADALSRVEDQIEYDLLERKSQDQNDQITYLTKLRMEVRKERRKLEKQK